MWVLHIEIDVDSTGESPEYSKSDKRFRKYDVEEKAEGTVFVYSEKEKAERGDKITVFQYLKQ